MPSDKTLKKKEKKRSKAKKCQRKYLFSKQSQICNVLSYYEGIAECDIIMRQLSHNSRKLWIDKIQMWIDYIGKDTEPICINTKTITHWTRNQCLYHCKLVFDNFQLQTKKWLTKILKFIKSLPNKSQIKRFTIYEKLATNKTSMSKICAKNVTQNILAIAQALGPEVLQRSTDVHFKEYKDVFYSDIITGSYFGGYIHEDLGIYPKVNESNKVVYVNSQFILCNKWILSCKNVQDQDYPDLFRMELNDNEIPIFSDIKKIGISAFEDEFFKDKEDLKPILSKCYPNLTHLKLSSRFYFEHFHVSSICEIMQGTQIEIKFEDDHAPCSHEIKIKSTSAFIIPAKNVKSTKTIYEFEVEACTAMFIIHKEFCYCYSFEIISVKNCKPKKPSKKQLALLDLLNNRFNILNYFQETDQDEWLIIPISHIQSIITDHSSFSECEIYQAESSPTYSPTSSQSTLSSQSTSPNPPFLSITELSSNWKFYSLLPSTCSLTSLLSPSSHPKTPFPSQSKSITHSIRNHQSKLSIEIPLYTRPPAHAPSFSLKSLHKFNKVMLTLFVHVCGSKEENEKLFGKVRKMSGSGNLERVKVWVYGSKKVSGKEVERVKRKVREVEWRRGVRVGVGVLGEEE